MLEDKIESILSEKFFFEETIKDAIFNFGNDQRFHEYRDRLNEIFINPIGKFKQRSPLYSSSTESSSIKFATSDDEDYNNGDEKAECGDKKAECGDEKDENGESMIVDDGETDKHEDAQGNGNDEDTANNESSIRDEASVNDNGTSNIRDEAAGNKDISRNKNDVAVENDEVSSRYKVHLFFCFYMYFCLSVTGDMRYDW